jgi:hypothetical protein
MAKPYSMDLGDRAMGRLAAGESSRVVAAADAPQTRTRTCAGRGGTQSPDPPGR